MAIDLPQQTLTIAPKRRTWRVELFTELGTDYQIRVWRETVWLDSESGEVIKTRKDPDPITRNFSGLQDNPTALQVAANIVALADQWDEEERTRQENAPQPAPSIE